jgi:hypothetical protein
MGDLGMDTSTGRPQAYISGSSRNLAYVGEGGGGLTFDRTYGVAAEMSGGGTGWTVAGAFALDPSGYPSGRTTTFFAIFAAAYGRTAECRLFNATDGAAVSGSTLATSSATLVLQSTSVTIPASAKLYEVQCRLTVATGGQRWTCANGGVLLAWT